MLSYTVGVLMTVGVALVALSGFQFIDEGVERRHLRAGSRTHRPGRTPRLQSY
ncbi:hypothetical protein [Naasia sp. SYSU D00057]|uniref:hypothetical protein n=1 Tax=Naasia sp. SYSU D00057 TaxID=2817380 RepID=UPI001B300852|nr:hypothetical protein [Naasia sp. SYSU D00057]